MVKYELRLSEEIHDGTLLNLVRKKSGQSDKDAEAWIETTVILQREAEKVYEFEIVGMLNSKS